MFLVTSIALEMTGPSMTGSLPYGLLHLVSILKTDDSLGTETCVDIILG